MKSKFIALLIGAVALNATTTQADNPACGNTVSPSKPPKKGPCDEDQGGPNFFRAYTANGFREANDLEIWGGVGEHQLLWKRTYTSRETGSPNSYFGYQITWRHAYQWEIADAGTNPSKLTLYYPDGTFYTFTQISTNQWNPVAGVPETVFQSGNHFTLQRQDGMRYNFDQLTNTYGQVYYQMQNFLDTQQNQYSFTYNTNGLLTRVTEPAGRYFQISYTNLVITRSTTYSPNVLSSITSAQAGWNDVSISFPYARRYLSYFSPDNSAANVAEVEFYDLSGTNLLTGTPFGTSPATAAGYEYDKAFDGNTNTFFDYAGVTSGFTGLDLGSGNTNGVGKIRFFPRAGYESRMNGGLFLAFYDFPQTLTLISKVETSDGRDVTYTYQQFQDPALPNNYYVLSGAVYGDSTQAAYTYAQTIPGSAPLLASMSDPRYPGTAPRIKYGYYDYTGGVFGRIKEENTYTGSNTIVSLGVYNGNNSMPKVVYSGGTSNVWLMYDGGNVYGKYDAYLNSSWFYYTQNGTGFLTNRWDNLGNKTSRSPTQYDHSLTNIMADGSVETFTRDDLDLVLTHTDELGRTTTYTRDGNHRVTRIDYPNSSYETFSYNSFGQMTSHRLRNGGTESNSYTTNGLKQTHTDSLSNVTSYSYDSHHRLASATDANSHTTSFDYNERGLVTKITNPDSSYRTFGYDQFGNRTNTVDELSHATTYVYDDFRRVVSVTDPLSRTTQYEYALDVGGGSCTTCSFRDEPTKITLPSGKQTTITYDIKRRKSSETVGAGSGDAATTSYSYDVEDNMTGMTDPRSKSWTYAYDNRNRRTSATDPLSHVTH